MITFDDNNLSGRNPQIVADLLTTLADGWKLVDAELPDAHADAKKPARKRAATKRTAKPKS